jgi:hypothetical protein
MSNNLVNIYEEFVDSNMDKRYPLVDIPYGASVNGLDIPDSFLADIKICIGMSDNAGTEEFKLRNNTYISNIKIYPDYIYVTLSATIASETKVIAESDAIPVNLTAGSSLEDRTIHIHPVSDIPVNGTLVVGTCYDIAKTPGHWDITKDCGLIFPANIIVMPDALNCIQVGDVRLSGDITLVAGDNVNISCDTTTNTITIDVVPPEESIVNMEDLMGALIDKYGHPVTMINGIPPLNGNVNIESTDCITLEASATNSTITLYNPCGNTCASEEFMNDTYTRISDLNKGLSVLTSFYNSVSNTLAQMGVRVASVLETRSK